MGMLDRLVTGLSRTAVEERELQQVTEDAGATPISACQRGDVITACGVVNSIVVRPRAGSPALEADLFDGTGHLKLVWLGRRRIAGVEAGRTITIKGRMTCLGDEITIYNPRYELRPRGTT